MAINSLSAASKGFSGLVSGINTQETVEKLLSGTQAKIDKANQKKSVLQMKQQLYRDVAAKLKNLQSSFLSFTSSTNLLSSAFYNNMTAAVTAPNGVTAGFSVTASTNASVGNTSVEYIKQLATAFTQETTGPASAQVQGAIDPAVAQKLLNDYRGINPELPADHYAQGADAVLSIRVGDQGVRFENAAELFGGKSATQVVDILNSKLAGIGAEAKYVNNKLTITANDPEAYIVVQGNQASDSTNKTLAMKMFGEVSSLSGKGTFSSAIDTDKYLPSFTVNLDGRSQEINISLEKLSAYVDAQNNTTLTAAEKAALVKTTAEDLVKDINSSLVRTFGAGVSAKAVTTDGVTTIQFKPGSESQKFTITGDSQVMGLMGMKTGISNKINANMAIKDLNFANALQGNSFAFSINGVDFHYTGDVALSTIMNDINNSKAGVKVSFNESKDRFVIQKSETGKGPVDENGVAIPDSIDLKQTEGNLLSALFGVPGSGSATGFSVTKELSGGALTQAEVDSFKRGGTFTFNINGKDVKFTVPMKSDENSYTTAEFAKKMNDAFASSYGFMADGTQALEFRYDDVSNSFSIVANNEDIVVKTVKIDGDTNKSLLGFTLGDSTRVQDGAAKLSDAGITAGTDGKITIQWGPNAADKVDITVGANATFDEIATAMTDAMQGSGQADLANAEVKFDKSSGAYKVLGVKIPMDIIVDNGTDGEGLEKLFGTDKLELGKTYTGGLNTVTEGQNAIVSINGVEIERASNTFEYNGLTFTLHTESKFNDVDDGQGGTVKVPVDAPTNVAVSRDTEAIVEGIKEYLKLYNETINYINELYKADATYKDYPPLTDDQKAEMSDREVELWEEKSKEGLLRNDSNLQRILDSLRKSMYDKPDGSSIAIYDLGISTSFYTSDGNFQESADGDLKAAIEKDPEAVRRLFAGEGGIMTLVNDAINEATKSSYGSPGYLTSVAGSNGLDTSSSIYKQIKEIDDQLVTLESRYWSEYDRYWKQFNAMEQMIQQMNTQSSWLSQMTGG